MARIFDPTTREEIQLPEAELNEAVASGKATFAANDLINVIAPDGSSGTIPATKIKDAITQGGFKIESPLQQAVREHVEKNDTLSGSVKVGLDQFANQALFGVPGIIGDKYKNPLEKLKDDAVKDDHQIANAIGGVAGFGASLFAGGPLFKGATKAGTLAEKAVASGLAEVGIKRGAQNIAADLAARVAENATRLGVESAILSTPQAGAHLINGDPELAAETLISNGVLGLGLGSIGGVFSTAGSRLKKSFGKTALDGDALNAAKTLDKEIKNPTQQAFSDIDSAATPLHQEAAKYDNVDDFLKAQGEPVYHGTSEKFDEFNPEKLGSTQGFNEPGFSFTTNKGSAERYASTYPQKLSFLWTQADKDAAAKVNVVEAFFNKEDSLNLKELVKLHAEGKIKTKPVTQGLFRPESIVDNNREAIKEAFEVTGKNVFAAKAEGTTNYVVSDVSKIKTKSQLEKIFNQAKSAKGTTGTAKGASKTDDLVSILTKKTPEDIAYTKTNLKRMEATPSMDEAAEKSIPKMFKEDYDKFVDVDLPAIEKKVSATLEKAKVKVNTKELADKIDNIVTQIESEGAFTEQEAKAIRRMLDYKERLVGGDLENPIYKDLTGNQLRKYMQKLRKDNSAFRKLNSPMGGDFTMPESVLMDYSESISNSLKDKVGPAYKDLMHDYASKVKLSINLDKQLSVNNAFQNRIKKPIQDKALGGYSTISFNPKQTNWYKNIEDFSKISGKDYPTMINDRLVYAKMFPERALKGDAPTLTARIADLAGKVDLAKPLQTVANLVTPSSETLLHSYVTNGGIINAATRSMAKINRIPEALNNFISKRIPVTLEGSSVSAIQRFLGTETKSREDQIQELNEKLGEFNENPALATEHMSNTTRQVPENIAAAVTAKNVAIAQYLGSHIPKPRAIPNPFNQNKWKPSDSEISRFERRVQAVENPLSIVDQLETGTLSKETVETVQTLYPKLYEMVQQKVVESMQNHKGTIPYSARMRLSLLMGETFDNSLKPENIRMMQQRFQQKPVQPQKTSGNMNLPSLETQSQRISSR